MDKIEDEIKAKGTVIIHDEQGVPCDEIPMPVIYDESATPVSRLSNDECDEPKLYLKKQMRKQEMRLEKLAAEYFGHPVQITYAGKQNICEKR